MTGHQQRLSVQPSGRKKVKISYVKEMAANNRPFRNCFGAFAVMVRAAGA